MKEQMKKMADFALLSALPVSILGAVFKYMHIHGANILLMVGLPSVALAALLKYLPQKNTEGYLMGFGIAAGCFFALFKLVHFSS
jgi:hypothetical protein